MKIAILGSAPSSLQKAPFGDPSWKIWACSPGSYPHLARVDQFWEVHRWEPGVIGKGATQKPWFTPEYVAWLKITPPILWVADPAALRDCANARMLPWQDLVTKYGHYVWTSSVSYMLAMAIETVLEARHVRAVGLAAERLKPDFKEPQDGVAPEPDVIGLWGIDMAANEELYTSQRAACQFFLQLINGLGIQFYVPPESDLCTPPPMYGVAEISHRSIKWLERKRELEIQLANAQMQEQQGHDRTLFLKGAIDDLDYMQKMWMHQGEETLAIDFAQVFPRLAGAEVAQQLAPVKAEAVMDEASAAAQVAPPSTGTST